jgi:hypothetical protein
MAVEQTQAPLRTWCRSFAPYNSILRTRSLLTLMGADAGSLACAKSSPNDFSQLLGSDSEMPVRCHGLYHCTCPFSWQGGLAAFIELERRFTWSRPPAIPLFARFECRIKTQPCPWPNPPRSSGKKLPLPKTVLLQRLFLERGRRAAFDMSLRQAKRVMQNQRRVNEHPTWLFWRPNELQNQPSGPILSILTSLATYLRNLTLQPTYSSLQPTYVTLCPTYSSFHFGMCLLGYILLPASLSMGLTYWVQTSTA